jgi:hypothetical protein
MTSFLVFILLRELYDLYTETPQELHPFVDGKSLEPRVAVHVKHFFDPDGEDHPCAGDARGKGNVKGGILHAYVVLRGIKDGVLLGVECQRAAALAVAGAACLRPYLVAVVRAGRRTVVAEGDNPRVFRQHRSDLCPYAVRAFGKSLGQFHVYFVEGGFDEDWGFGFYLLANYELGSTNYELRSTSYELRSTSYKLRITSYEVRVSL